MSDCSYVKIMNEYKRDNNINEMIKKDSEHYQNIIKLVAEKK